MQLLPGEATWRVERKGRWAAGKVGRGAQIGAPKPRKKTIAVIQAREVEDTE